MKKILYILLIIVSCVSCRRAQQTQREQAPLRVKTMLVAPKNDVSQSRYIGAIEPVHETPLCMQSTGRVVNIHAKNGQRVRKGQKILEIDNTQAMNALQGAEASLKHAQDGYNRVHQVHEKGVVTDQKMVEVESQLSQAEALYQAAKQRLNECSLVAPCDGVIDGLSVEMGQTILPGVTVCAILDLSGYSVRFTVPEAEIRVFGDRRQIKGTVECTAVDTVFPVVITEKSVTANPLTHTYDVVARIQGGVDVLMAGMVGKVTVSNDISSVADATIVIPAKCILLKPEGHTVWVAEHGKAVRKTITIGGYQADGVQVKSGLQPGDTLITDGYQKLYNDCKIICEY